MPFPYSGIYYRPSKENLSFKMLKMVFYNSNTIWYLKCAIINQCCIDQQKSKLPWTVVLVYNQLVQQIWSKKFAPGGVWTLIAGSAIKCTANLAKQFLPTPLFEYFFKFLNAFIFFMEKEVETQTKMISSTEQHVKHLFAGGNTQ